MKIVCFNSAFIDVENYLIYYRRYSCPVLRDSVIKSPGVLLKMDAPFVNGEENSLLDVLENPNSEQADRHVGYSESLTHEVERSLSMLSQKQAEVLKMYFGIGMEEPVSLEDIGARYDLTRERVRQIKDKALDRLKHGDKCKLLRSYLG